MDVLTVGQAPIFVYSQMMRLNVWPPVLPSVPRWNVSHLSHVEQRDANLRDGMRRHLDRFHIHAEKHNLRRFCNRALHHTQMAKHILCLLLAALLPLDAALFGRQLGLVVRVASQQRQVGAVSALSLTRQLLPGRAASFIFVCGPGARILQVEPADVACCS